MNNPNTPLPGQDEFDRMERSLFTAVAESEKKRTRHRRLLAGGATLAIVAGALTTASIVTQADRAATFTANASASQDAAPADVVYCYAEPGPSSPFVVASEGAAAPGLESRGPYVEGGKLSAAEAIRLCAEHYAVQTAGPVQGADQSPGATRSSALSFHVCQREDQAYAVFPRIAGDAAANEGFCTAMGMTASTKGK